ncbi:MAG TPA: MFS transporter [Arachnia sp.]|nr:MFS transporter [Arachnia sp.]
MKRTMTATPPALGARAWATVVLVGLVGQLAWTIENMYLNVFVYNTITTDPTVIAVLVAASAVAATLATLTVGAWSDRVGRRREFIAAGYVLWGATTAAFGLVRPQLPDGVALGAPEAARAVGVAVVTIVVLDCVMSLFGSGANDAAFNAWVTDSTTPANRGRVDGVLATLPLVSMLIVFGLLDGLTQRGDWELFFGIVGATTAAVGVVAWFLVRDRRPLERVADGYLASLVHGLRPSTMRAHPRLYVTLLAVAILGVSSQVYLPYLIIYLQRFLQIDAYALALGVVLILASLVSVAAGRFIDRVGKTRAILPLTALLLAGLVGMFLARGLVSVIVAGTVMMGGMLGAGAAAAATVRDHTPAGRVGMVQGLRMVALVLVPMVVGPFIGAAVIVGANETYVDLGVERQVPTPWMFLFAAAIALLVIAPVTWLRRLPEERP